MIYVGFLSNIFLVKCGKTLSGKINFEKDTGHFSWFGIGGASSLIIAQATGRLSILA